MKVKNDHCSKFSYSSNRKEEACKNQAFNRIRTRGATHWEWGQFTEFISPMRSEMMWSIYQVICIWTVVAYESEEWSSTAMIILHNPPLFKVRQWLLLYIFFKEAIIWLLYSYTPEMTKDWGSMVEEEEEKGSRMQTRNKTNSRYYIICKLKQQLSPGLKHT